MPFIDRLLKASTGLTDFCSLLTEGPIRDAKQELNLLETNALNPAFYLWLYGKTDLAIWEPVLNVIDGMLAAFINRLDTLSDEDAAHICALIMFLRLLLENSSTIGAFKLTDKIDALCLCSHLGVLEASLTLLSLVVKRFPRSRISTLNVPMNILEVYSGLRAPLQPAPDAPSEDNPVAKASRIMLSFDFEAFQVCQLISLSTLFDTRHFLDDFVTLKSNPTIISETARLLCTDGGAREDAAMQAIRSALRLDYRWGEINYALSLSSNHGPVLRILKTIVSAEEPKPFYDAHYLITYFNLLLAMTSAFPEALVAADVIEVAVMGLSRPLILGDGNPLANRQVYKVFEKLASLLEIALLRDDLAMDAFYSANGMHVVVDQVVAITTFMINQPASNARVALSQALLAMLKLLMKMLTSMGFDERLRTLIDGPLFTTIKDVFSMPSLLDAFDQPILNKFLSIVANYIHNEPTALAFMQEQEITSPILKYCVGPAYKRHDLELLKSLPLLYSALCLNPAGLEVFKSTDPLTPFLSIFKDENYEQTLSTPALAYNLGTSIDELVRHHPQLAVTALEAMVDIFKTGFVDRQPVELFSTSSPADTETPTDSAPPHTPTPTPLPEVYSPSMRMFECFCMFLEAALKNKMNLFLSDYNGLALFMNILRDKRFLFHFNFNLASAVNHIVSILRMMVEVKCDEVLNAVTTATSDAVEEFLQLKRAGSASLAYPFHMDLGAAEGASSPTDIGLANEAFRALCKSLALFTICCDLCFNASNTILIPKRSIIKAFWDGGLGNDRPSFHRLYHLASIEYLHVKGLAAGEENVSIDPLPGHGLSPPGPHLLDHPLNLGRPDDPPGG